jgi:hypothetical protein
MKEEKLIELIKKVHDQAKIFKSRKIKGLSDEKRHDLIKRDEQKWMWTTQNKLGWSIDKIGSVFGRDPRSVKRAINKVQPPQGQHQKTTPNPNLIKHYTELSITGLILASNFESYLNAPGTDDDFTGKIGDVAYGGWLNLIGGVRDALSVEMNKVDKRIASNVLLHIKLEFPELTEIEDWAELTDYKITKNFIERLRLKANRGDFMGKCPDCPH